MIKKKLKSLKAKIKGKRQKSSRAGVRMGSARGGRYLKKYFADPRRQIAALIVLITAFFLVSGSKPARERDQVSNYVIEKVPDSAAIPLGIRPAKVSMVNPFKSRIFFSLNTVRNVLIFSLAVAIAIGTVITYLEIFEKGPAGSDDNDRVEVESPKISTNLSSDKSGGKSKDQKQKKDKKPKKPSKLAAQLFKWSEWAYEHINSVVILTVITINLVLTFLSSKRVIFDWSTEALDFWSIRSKEGVV